jgi:RNA-directed DNA polymerase
MLDVVHTHRLAQSSIYLQIWANRERCADDCSIGCAFEADAQRVMDVLPKRLHRFGRTMHPEKTALMACKKPPSRDPSAGGAGTVDFLGLTH